MFQPSANPLPRLTRLFIAFSVMNALCPAQGAFAQAVHTPHDHIPDFCSAPTIRSVSNGRWSDSHIWSTGQVPASNAAVRIEPGTTVTFDQRPSARLDCVGVGGVLTFDTQISTSLLVGTLMVYDTGSVLIGSTSAPLPDTVSAEIVIANKPLDLVTDPDQFGTGFLALGRVSLHGAPRALTFARVVTEPKAGQTTLVFGQAMTGWKAGDRLILPDTRHLRWNEVQAWMVVQPQWEELTVASVSSDGRTLSLTSPLHYDHLGARDLDGVLDFLPHVGNLSRNITIRSEVPIGQAGTHGHVLFTHRANIDVEYTLLKDLGRTTIAPLNSATNHIGRYGLHMHHVMGPLTTPSNGYQFTLVGNVIDGGTLVHDGKWAMAIHNSHYGLIRDNVLYNYAGSLLMFEDGQESFNVVERNFAVRSAGTGGRLGEGREGGGFWFRGPNNYVRQNVAANIMSDGPDAGYGFKYFQRYLGEVRVPSFKGADTSIAGQYVANDGNKMPLLEFSDNEVYGATGNGLSYWWVNSQDPTPNQAAAQTTVRNLHIWHVFARGVFHYPSARVTFEGLVIRGRDPQTAACCGTGWHGEDYGAATITLRHADIQGMNTGVRPSTIGVGPQVVEDSYLRNVTNVQIGTLFSSNGPQAVPPRLTVLRNVTFASMPGHALKSIDMNWNPQGQSNTTQVDRVLVYKYQGNPADNFQTFYTVQATQPFAGGLAPCTATRSDVAGIACAVAPEDAPPLSAPAAPSNVVVAQGK